MLYSVSLCFTPLSFCVCLYLLVQAVVMKLAVDSVTASYFALFEVINHTFGE